VNQRRSLQDQLKALEFLQELDLKIDSVKRKKADQPGELKTAEESYRKAHAAREVKQNALNEIEKVQRQTLAAMELNKDRVVRANAKLEAVRNSQEFQAANKEIDQLKKLNVSLDAQMKKSDQEATLIKQEIEQLDAQSVTIKAALDGQKAVMDEQSKHYDAEITSLMSERTKYTSQVDARLLSQYGRVRGARGGIGIVPAVGGRCSGCNMVIPPQLFNEVQRGAAVHQCPSCHRILFVPQAQQNNTLAATGTSSEIK
jgi:uncharacterized protein